MTHKFYDIICPKCGWTCGQDHGGNVEKCSECGEPLTWEVTELPKECTSLGVRAFVMFGVMECRGESCVEWPCDQVREEAIRGGTNDGAVEA